MNMRIYEANMATEAIAKAFKKLIPQLSPNCSVPSKSELENLINSNNTLIFVAEENEIIGTLTLVFNKIPTGNKVWIEDVVVDNAVRGKGVGEELTKFAIEYVTSKGIKQINLTSGPERIAANKLYQKLGFTKRETNVYRLTIEE
jgi:ribosomal protein S18 acetylase RimI-like enzyme